MGQKTYRIAVVPGDGIGNEIVPEAVRVLAAAGAPNGVRLDCTTFPFGARYYKDHGHFMPPDGLATLKAFDAILFGAVGLPDVDDRLPFQEFTANVRVSFQQYVNYRPVRVFPGVRNPLNRSDFDFVVIRENTEGEFVLAGSVLNPDSPQGVATQLSVFTRGGIERVARYAFELSRKRRRRLTNVTKSNTLIHSLAFWDRVIAEVAKQFPDVQYERMYVDAVSANLVLRPDRFDVLLTTNMMGDILSDLGGALMGSLGLGGSGNINPDKAFPSMFEPIHGSAPDIAGRGIANPVGTIWAGAMMLEHLGERASAKQVLGAIDAALRDGVLPADLGGTATTRQVTDAVIERL